MTETTHLGLPYLAAAQAQKHVTHNEALTRLDAVVQLAVIDTTLTAPPVSPDDGDRYIVAAGATGAWAGHEGEIAAFVDGAWTFIAAGQGWVAYDTAAEAVLVRHDGDWVAIGSFLGAVDRFGVNATPDATNRLAVRSNALLFSGIEAADGGTGDVRIVVNKEADGDTASLLFQSGFSGRAEVGLAGDTDFVFKVSPDGSAWTESIRIDKDTGLATILYDNAVSGLAATTVQEAIDEVAASGGGGTVASVFGRTGTVVAATSDYDAVQVDFAPAGAIAASNVQAAIEELDAEKLGKAGGTMTGFITLHADPSSAMHAATKQYADQIIASADAMVFKGVVDCSANPNYPAADRGHTYRVSVAGKIGGGSGVNVEAGDILLCLTDGTASGNQATAGTAWSIAQVNLDGAVIGPASVTDDLPAIFDGTTGKLIKSKSYAAFKTLLALVKADVGLGNVDNTSDATKNAASVTLTNKTINATNNTVSNLATSMFAANVIDTDGTLAANSDTRLASQKAVRTYVDRMIAGHRFGCTIANNAGDATNDIDISAGISGDDTGAVLLRLASGITKRLDAAWTVGSGNGGLDTGSIANTTYHLWLIMRSDTGVVDVLFSASATAPTMPANYDYKAYLAPIVRASGAIRPFVQDPTNPDVFRWVTGIVDRTSTSAAAEALLTVSVPSGVQVEPIFETTMGVNTSSAAATILRNADAATPGSRVVQAEAGGSGALFVFGGFVSNTSAQIRFTCTIFFGTITSNVLTTMGFIHRRGRRPL